MMKNKFIIGDIVKEGVIEFINFSGNEYAISKEGEFTIVTTNPEPLLLTSDFLKGHGFIEIGVVTNYEKQNDAPIYSKLDLRFCIYKETENNCFNITVNGNILRKDIKYVHEFQHFLFGLGQEL